MREEKEARGEVGSTEAEAEGLRNITTKFLREKKEDHEKIGSSIGITVGMICLDALLRDLRSLEQNNGKTQGQSDSDTRSSMGVGYRDDLVEGIRVVDQMSDSTGSQNGLSTAGV